MLIPRPCLPQVWLFTRRILNVRLAVQEHIIKFIEGQALAILTESMIHYHMTNQPEIQKQRRGQTNQTRRNLWIADGF